MSEQKLGWGVLGAARINRRVIPGIKAAYNADLRAIASRDQSKAQAAATQWGIPTAYGSYDELLADSQIEVIYIPLPNSLHKEWCIKAAQAGKHVLCEKPLALTVPDVEEIAAAAQQYDVQIMEAFAYRFHPQQAKVRELLASDAIGEVKVIRGTFAFPMANGYNIRLDKELGGGATWDVGCYGVNVSRWMFGSEPLSVFAQATLQNEVDMNTAAILDFGDGRRAVLDYGMSYGRRSFYEIIGTKGTLSVENMWQEAEVPGYLYLRDDKGLTTTEFSLINHFQLEAEALGEAIINRLPNPYPLSDSAQNARVCLAILASIAQGKSVDL